MKKAKKHFIEKNLLTRFQIFDKIAMYEIKPISLKPPDEGKSSCYSKSKPMMANVNKIDFTKI